jgi:hypothetical protein
MLLEGSVALSQVIGTNAAALGGVESVLPHDTWSMYHNPAGLAQLKEFSLSSFLSPGEFGLSQLRRVAGSMVLPTSYGVLGLGADQFGFDLYRETSLLCGLGAEIADGCLIGMAMDYRMLGIKGYGSDRSVCIGMGGLVSLTSDIVLGFDAQNITGTTVGTRKERLPQSLALGVCYGSPEKFVGIAEVEKDIRYPVSWRFGIQQAIIDAVVLSMGLAEHPYRFSTGLAVRSRWISVAWSGDDSPDLGWTHYVEVNITP